MRPTTLFIVFAIGALGFLAYAGKLSGIKAPAIPKLEMPNIQLPSAMKSIINSDEQQTNDNVTAYKWQDTDGQWHYGNTPPKGIKAEALSINTEQNVLLSPKASQAADLDTNETQDTESPPSAMPVPYQEIQKMLGLQSTPAESQKTAR